MEANHLDRFVQAQEKMYLKALTEVQGGKKRSHWMWYIFPQLRSLGVSDTATYYGIADINEAIAYMAHSYLRENLITISRALLRLETSDPYKVMGEIDALKLCSCMTLFEVAASEVPEFSLVLEKFYSGIRDKETLKILKSEKGD